VGQLLAFLGISALVIVTPGQDTALTIKNTLAGAAYLVLLGAQALLAAFRGAPAHELPGSPRRLVPASGYRQGVVSNLGNPKMAVFFTSLLPQFAPAGRSSFATMLGLGLVFCSMTFVWLTAYAAAVDRAGHVLRRAGVRRALDAATGTVLVALGLRLAAQDR
jgi:threonine/homoserine/homoserine lactone efflux protein